MRLEEIRKQHQAWLDKPDTSRGQRDDSATILHILSLLDEARECLRTIAKGGYGCTCCTDEALERDELADEARACLAKMEQR